MEASLPILMQPPTFESPSLLPESSADGTFPLDGFNHNQRTNSLSFQQHSNVPRREEPIQQLFPSAKPSMGSIIHSTNVATTTVVQNHLQYPYFLQHLMPPHQQQNDIKLLLKPLSPYNYYYRDERDNIVNHLINEHDALPPAVSDATQARLESLLYQHWFLDPLKEKRIHRKSHGMITFEALSKVIAERWQKISDPVREFYRTVAHMDKIYYHEQTQLINTICNEH
jgi:hypothetical protein